MKCVIPILRCCLFSAFIIMLATSCGKDSDLVGTIPETTLKTGSTINYNIARNTQDPENLTTADLCGDPLVTDLFAGQNILVGSVSIQNTATDLIITINTDGGWYFSTTHVYVGSAANLPLAGNNNPQIGLFPYQTVHNPMADTYTYTIPLTNLDSCFVVAVHADMNLVDENGDVIQTETGWADGEDFTQQGSWGSYINYCTQSCCVITTESYDIYGGQTILVGSLDVTNDDVNLYVTWNMTGCWTLAETHLYVGDPANIPVNGANTPVPGQFPYSSTHNGVTSYTYTVPLANLPACYAIAAHASTNCTDGNGDTQQETAWSDGTDFPNTNRWGWYSEYCTQNCD